MLPDGDPAAKQIPGENMQYLTYWIGHYGLWFVFVSVFATQLGLPLPAYPTLVLAAALLIPATHSFATVLGVSVGAALLADLFWYQAGHLLGHRVLATLCRVSLSPDSCIRQTESIYHRFGAPSLTVAKFIPGFAAVATAMAGTLETPMLAFLAFDALGSVLWSGLALLLGLLFRDAIWHAFDVLNELGRVGLFVIATGLLLFVALKWWERRRLYRTLRMARITVQELHELVEGEAAPIIFDVRSVETQKKYGKIPGARSVNEKQLAEQLEGLPRTGEVVVYCACPSEASAAHIAKLIMSHGFARVRPLQGGIDEWIDQGFPVEGPEVAFAVKAEHALES
jgi:membrane protein DedA with SNARE-associated domain/rhodanese-related sulfurtransferase